MEASPEALRKGFTLSMHAELSEAVRSVSYKALKAFATTALVLYCCCTASVMSGLAKLLQCCTSDARSPAAPYASHDD
eukprot:COSAG02_NODE_51139_length_316_cov_0.700461_1_plen_77_part_01